jgi:hypothetical protein
MQEKVSVAQVFVLPHNPAEYYIAIAGDDKDSERLACADGWSPDH